MSTRRAQGKFRGEVRLDGIDMFVAHVCLNLGGLEQVEIKDIAAINEAVLERAPGIHNLIILHDSHVSYGFEAQRGLWGLEQWQKVSIVIPDPACYNAIEGMLFISENTEAEARVHLSIQESLAWFKES